MKEQDEVSGFVPESMSDYQPGYSYTVEKPASASGATDKMVNE